mgnify:CR=1 FL=1
MIGCCGFGNEVSETVAPRSIGYSHVSTAHQVTDAQVAALMEAGCDLVFHEVVSTRVKESDRQELHQALRSLIESDELVVAKLDRLGRTQVEVINRLHSLQESGIDVRTLDGLINTRALGKMCPLVVGLLTGLAEVERDLIKTRTLESIAHRMRTGVSLGGRPNNVQTRADLVRSLRASGDSHRVIREKTGICLANIRRILVESEAAIVYTSPTQVSFI